MNLQNPNALDSKVLLDFDHVKKSLKLDDEGKLRPFTHSALRLFLIEETQMNEKESFCLDKEKCC